MKFHPSHALILSFIFFIVIGTFFLSLSISSKVGSLNIVDSFFMASSAMCVTGLSVINIGEDFTFFGQIVILILVQLGGIGIMTFSTVFMLFIGKQVSARDRMVIQELFLLSGDKLESIIKHIFYFTFIIEAIGAILLFLRWRVDFPFGKAVYYGIFHSISAFCNAGFTLFPDSLSNYKTDTAVNLIIMFLIITGGLGFLILKEIKFVLDNRIIKKKRFRLSLHTKMALSVTIFLLCFGTLMFFILEYNHTLRNLSLYDKSMASVFQIVTMRTAGFNTLDFANMTNATIFVTLIFMFIGACPGSTGGGIKTTTIGVHLAILKSRFEAREDVSIFKRTLPMITISKSIAVLFAGVFVVLCSFFIITLTEAQGSDQIVERGMFLKSLFEIISAYGTVGLSLGVTGDLSSIGRVVLSIVMLIGRLGPLTVAIAVSHKEAKVKFRYAEENIMVG